MIQYTMVRESPSTNSDDFTDHLNIFLRAPVIFNNYSSVLSENSYISAINDFTRGLERVYESENIDRSVNCFIETLKDSLYRCSSKNKLKRWEVHWKKWITNALIKSIRYTEEFHKK
nr:unnamed protein product [Callosobruchus analis]